MGEFLLQLLAQARAEQGEDVVGAQAAVVVMVQVDGFAEVVKGEGRWVQLGFGHGDILHVQ